MFCLDYDWEAVYTHYILIFYEMFNLKCVRVGSKIAFVSVDHIVDTSGKVYGGVTAVRQLLQSATLPH